MVTESYPWYMLTVTFLVINVVYLYESISFTNELSIFYSYFVFTKIM